MGTFRMRRVFVPGGEPEYTYVARTELQLEPKLRAASDNLCKLVTVTGPTKCGKSVLTQKVYPRNEHNWVEGGSVDNEEDLWRQVVDNLDLFTYVERTEEEDSGKEFSGEVSTKGGIPFIGEVGGKGSSSHNRSRSTGVSNSRDTKPKTRALQGLEGAKGALIIDDFHYLDLDTQASVVRALKGPISRGLPAILIAIPHRRYDAVRVEKEMTGRVENVTINSWQEDELAEIPKQGFPLLNVSTSDEILNTFLSECLYSPHLMQEFCRQLCDGHGIEETCFESRRLEDVDSLNALFTQVAEDTSKTIFDRLMKGPRQRSDRNQREFKDGRTGDIYVAVLNAIADLKPGTTTIQYEEIRSSLRDLLIDLPQAHEVSRVLEHMSNIQADEASSVPVLDWEKEERKLHIIDPFFAFFLRWGGIEEREQEVYQHELGDSYS